MRWALRARIGRGDAATAVVLFASLSCGARAAVAAQSPPPQQRPAVGASPWEGSVPAPARPIESQWQETRRPLDAGVADQSSLSRSLRRPNLGLQEGAFEQLLAVPDGSGRLMRRQGGLTAVYAPGMSGGANAGSGEIPAGTIFQLGRTPGGARGVLGGGRVLEARPPRTGAASGDAAAVAPRPRVPGAQAGFGAGFGGSYEALPSERRDLAAGVDEVEPMPRLLADPAYRAVRVRALLAEAAAAAGG